MSLNQKIYFTNSIGTIYDSKVKLSKKPNEILNIIEISYMELKVIKLKSINNLLYSLFSILLVLDLYLHYSGIYIYTIRALMFLLLIISVNLKIIKKNIRIVDIQKKEIIISIKRKDFNNAIIFIKEFNSKKNTSLKYLEVTKILYK